MAEFLTTGVSGLLAFQRSLATTSHNIANVNTEGYTRQRVEFGARPPQFAGGAYVGAGVQVDTIRRVYDQFLTDQVRDTSILYHQQETLYGLASQVDNILADSSTGVMPALQNFFNAVQDLANDPSSTSARRVLLGEAESLTSRMNSFYTRFEGLQSGIRSEASAYVSEINTISKSIASINNDVLNSSGAPNDLLDRRDQMVAKLAEFVSVSTVEQSDGTLSVFVGNGQSLVVGTESRDLSVIDNQYDPARFEIGYSAGNNSVEITRQLSGGKIGGLVAFREQVLDPAFNSLGRVAMGLAETFNEQHSLGVDLDGELGGDFFDMTGPQVLQRGTNGGTGAVSATIGDFSALTTSDYLLRSDDGANNYTLTRLTDGKTFAIDTSNPPPYVADGLELTITAGAGAGDTFLIRPTRKGAESIGVAITDTNKLAVAGPLRAAAATDAYGLPVNVGSASITSGELVSRTGNTLPATPVTLTYDQGNSQFVVSIGGVPTGDTVSYTSANSGDTQTLTIAGLGDFEFSLSGAPADGDRFVIGENSDGLGDNRNALLLGELQSESVLNNGAATFHEAYGDLVAEIGTVTKRADMSRAAQSVLLEQSISAREGVSGVNLDEEAADLMRFQQAYQAAAQVITVANTLFDTILGAMRR